MVWLPQTKFAAALVAAFKWLAFFAGRATLRPRPMTEGVRSVRPPASHRGVWYACGTVNTLPGKKYVYSGPMATYSVWHRPMAIYAPAQDKTFFVYGNPDNAPAISFYDHRRARFAPPVVLGSNPDGDAHRNPTLLLDEQGFLHVFFGAHGHPSQVVKSARPFDIADWRPAATLSDPKGTYPQPWQLTPRELFVSYRHAPGWRCRVSRNGAASWEPPLDVIAVPAEGKLSVYAVSIAETGRYPRKLHLAWSRVGGGSPAEKASKHLWARRYNVYYACTDDGGRTWKRSNGARYDLPIVEREAEKVYDCGPHGVWLKDIQLDPRGNPCILFIDAVVETYESAWKFARLSGGRWLVHDVTTSDHMYDDPALVVLGEADYRIYGPSTASQPGEDGGEIEEWRSTDGGSTWANTRHLTAGGKLSHNCVKTVWNHERGRGDLRVIWSHGDSVFPPSTREVLLYGHGEGRDAPVLIEKGD